MNSVADMTPKEKTECGIVTARGLIMQLREKESDSDVRLALFDAQFHIWQQAKASGYSV